MIIMMKMTTIAMMSMMIANQPAISMQDTIAIIMIAGTALRGD